MGDRMQAREDASEKACEGERVRGREDAREKGFKW